MNKYSLVGSVLVVFLFQFSYAAASLVGIVPVPERIWLSQDQFLAGDSVQIQTIVVNSSPEEFRGTLEFLDGKTVIGKKDILLTKGESIIVSLPWIATDGQKLLSARIIDPLLGTTTTKLGASATTGSINQFVDLDTDHDRLGNTVDTDDDNDGLLDTAELKKKTDPLNPDTDGDGIMDGSDPDPLLRNSKNTSASTSSDAQSSTTASVFDKLPSTVGTSAEKIMGDSESFRGEIASHAREDLTSVINELKHAVVSDSASNTPIQIGETDSRQAQTEGWGLIRQSIDKGYLTKTPWQYTKLFLTLCYDYVTHHPWLFYGSILLGLVWVIRIVSSIFLG